MRDWAIVHWKGYNSEGKEVQNSRQQYDKMPKAFEVGRYKVSKCWDIAIQQMKAGGTYKFSCPEDLDLGPTSTRYYAMNSNVPLTGASRVSGDMSYEVEILEAGPNPPMLNQLWNSYKGIKNDVCFYLVSVDASGRRTNYAVEANAQDKYHPSKTGAYNIALGEFKGSNSGNKQQQWTFSQADDTILSKFHDNSSILEGTNKNLIAYKNIKLPAQKFKYDLNSRILMASATGNQIGVEGGNFKAGSNIASFNSKEAPGHKWDIVYCS